MSSEIYWIQFDPKTHKITKFTQDNKINDNSWRLVAVSNTDDQYFRNNYAQISYDPVNHGLVYPNAAATGMQTVNSYSNNTVNSLKALYDQNSTAISNVSQRYFNSLSSVANSASSYDQTVSSEMSDVKGIAAINKGVNYLNGGQEEGIKVYVLYGMAFDFTHIYDALPTKNKPVELSFKVESPYWKYIYPQLQKMDHVDLNLVENYVNIYGNNVDDLKNVVATKLSQHANTAWAVLHYGAQIKLPVIGLYYR